MNCVIVSVNVVFQNTNIPTANLYSDLLPKTNLRHNILVIFIVCDHEFGLINQLTSDGAIYRTDTPIFTCINGLPRLVCIH